MRRQGESLKEKQLKKIRSPNDQGEKIDKEVEARNRRIKKFRASSMEYGKGFIE